MKNGKDHFYGGEPCVKFGRGSKHYQLVKELNASRITGHSIHRLFFDCNGNAIAAKCNCSGGVSHPIVIGVVLWATHLDIEQVQALKKG